MVEAEARPGESVTLVPEMGAKRMKLAHLLLE